MNVPLPANLSRVPSELRQVTATRYVAPLREGGSLPGLMEADDEALAKLPASDRFGWLTAPSSTVIQPSAVHTGMTEDPQATLYHLFETLVA